MALSWIRRANAKERSPEHCGICDEWVRECEDRYDPEDDDTLRWCEEIWDWVCRSCCRSCEADLKADTGSDNCELLIWAAEEENKNE